ncbi:MULTISPECIES: phage shock protein operon transcriptional activator [Vibrio]|uniref:phage shock protein operon transcriptional activator n=1 Tax=Vibrio TaxID=662 RepID=UPI002074E68D|nr:MULTISPECIES: phage shock protein operon transcriptional activator [Vibrio]USD33491.1 phage shock protein operon transcriptional activator [Vibrio sp. SCSIO 43186]USD46560.1 phage shock protein operon transcriptional activator [Vibrio sp. SCSIO 43145]USD70615.1 phage shock protein operon transcriptional activator [Vibrio sp. SCSIO 43139]USD95535.1 phage shock protein operon transcriptional activator [Vibrio coralliilyticus]
MQQNLIGESPAFLTILDKVSKLAAIERPILIIGERGTGKELIAQRLHYLSKRWDQPLISLNCSTLSEGLIDSELFGHEQGAFTGSKGRHKGRFERAENGTLFLDELATAPLLVQEKLLRVIEYGQYERVGGHQLLNANVRLICATNADLPTMAEDGKFRADLLDRLAFDVIHLPPLRERQEDILLLAEYYAIKMCRELNFDYFVGFSPDAQQALLDYQWPGNVRELKNVIERAVYQHGQQDEPIKQLIFDPFATQWQTEPEPVSLQSQPLPDQPTFHFPMDYKAWQESQDIRLLKAALEESKFNQRKAADMLGLSYHQLRGMIRKYDLSNLS